MKKRRAPGSSPSGCLASITTSTHSPSHSTPASLSPSTDTTHSSPPPCHAEREKSEKDRHRETAILDDGDCSPLRPDRLAQPCYGRPYSHTHSFRGPDLTNPQALAQTHNPKHHTLPCNRTTQVPVRDLCVSQPDLVWERGRCLHHHPCAEAVRHLYSYPLEEPILHSSLSHPQSSHSHTLPPQTRTFFTGEACPLIHCSAFSQSHTHMFPSLPTNQSLLPSPYRELHFSSAPPTSCTCRDCSRLREDVALRFLKERELEGLPWSREAECGFRRDSPLHWRDRRAENHWEGVQEAEFWRRKTMMSPVMVSYGHCHSVPKHDPALYVADTQPEHITPLSPFPSPQSSGYHSPHPACPCSPQVLRESPSYASISHSPDSSSFAFTPSPQRAIHNNAEMSKHILNGNTQ